MMRAIHVVPCTKGEACGPSYSVPMLCRALAIHEECEVDLHTLLPLPDYSAQWNFQVHAWPRSRWGHSSFGRSPAMLRGLKKACREADIIHDHSLWMMPNIYPEFARRHTDCKLVISPRGCLATWALERSGWKKRISGFLGQTANLRAADMFHATSVKEYREIRAYGLKQPVMILPNGIDLPEAPPAVAEPSSLRRILFLGRIHPVKGIEFLLDAWESLAKQFGDWELCIVGPGDPEYVAKLKRSAVALPRVTFFPEQNGDERTASYCSAEIYVLPSFTENFGMTVAEALICGTPVITTDGTPWTELAKQRAGWCVPVGSAALGRALQEALQLSREELAEMGRNGRQWMERDFNWPAIGERMIGAYRWLLDKGVGKPDYVVED